MVGGYERQEIKDGPRQARMVLHGATFGFLFNADLLGVCFCNRCGYPLIFLSFLAFQLSLYALINSQSGLPKPSLMFMVLRYTSLH